jgi:hypothetical protein
MTIEIHGRRPRAAVFRDGLGGEIYGRTRCGARKVKWEVARTTKDWPPLIRLASGATAVCNGTGVPPGGRADRYDGAVPPDAHTPPISSVFGERDQLIPVDDHDFTSVGRTGYFGACSPNLTRGHIHVRITLRGFIGTISGGH